MEREPVSKKISHSRPQSTGSARLPGKLYRWTRAFWRFAFFFTMRVRSSGAESLSGSGGLILAVTHRSHLDPVVVSTIIEREVGWMARVEFYNHRVLRAMMNAVGAFPVDRMKPGRAPIREAMRRLQSGSVVGIFPEGEIQTDGNRVTHGGSIKAGAVYLAALTGCPIVPVVVVGTEKLSSPWPWMPAKWGRLWVRFGEPFYVGVEARGRRERQRASERLKESIRLLYVEALGEWNMPEGRAK